MLSQTADPELNKSLTKDTPPQSANVSPLVDLQDDGDRQAPAKAIGLAALLSLPMWALIAVAIYFII